MATYYGYLTCRIFCCPEKTALIKGAQRHIETITSDDIFVTAAFPDAS